MKTKNQKGFALIEGIAIFAIVAMIGFVGWYVYHAKNNTDKSYSGTDTVSNNTNPISTKNTEQKPTTPVSATPTPAPTPTPPPTSKIIHPTNANCPSNGSHFTVYASNPSGTPIYDSNNNATNQTTPYKTALTVGCNGDTNSSELLWWGTGGTIYIYHPQDVSMTQP
jgi:cytoskeletal protein RodZ